MCRHGSIAWQIIIQHNSKTVFATTIARSPSIPIEIGTLRVQNLHVGKLFKRVLMEGSTRTHNIKVDRLSMKTPPFLTHENQPRTEQCKDSENIFWCDEMRSNCQEKTTQNDIVFMCQTLLCSWAYVSCQYNSCTTTHVQKACKANALFLKVGKDENPSNISGRKSDDIQRMRLNKSMCHLTLHVTCVAASLDQLRPKMAHERNIRKTGSCFCLITKTHYGL